MTSVTPDAAESAKEKDPKLVSIIFNKEPLEIPKGEHTGAQIKQFAIDKGIDIQLDFPLAVKHGNKFENIADTDVVKVHANMEFTAIAGDDNS